MQCICISLGVLPLLLVSGEPAENFTSGTASAVRFGVHEIVLSGNDADVNPFDTIATVTFTPPSGVVQSRRVRAFYDGMEQWRARVYVHETGVWHWSSHSETDSRLDGRSGTFEARDSRLSGRLLSHPRNSRHWMTEDGRWFLNLSDTAYFLLCTHDAQGDPVSDADFRDYVEDDAARGITSLRCLLASGADGFVGDDGADTHRWQQIFADKQCTRLRLENLQTVDRRLSWLLNHHPEIYVQLILFPLGRYAADDRVWNTLDAGQKDRLLQHLVSRFAAFPQLFWLMVNDAHYGDKYPVRNALVREAGQYFRQHDLWDHPRSTGFARKQPFSLGQEEWVSYVHIEDLADLAAVKYEQYHDLAKPVFLGEDRYEQDHGPSRDPADMRYFQRRLFWSWLFSGGTTNYGGRWGVVTPYSKTGSREWSPADRKGARHRTQLTGLDSVMPMRNYFRERDIELVEFVPEHTIARDAASAQTIAQALKVMRRDDTELLIYHPHAKADGIAARADSSQTAALEVDLRQFRGVVDVEWFRAEDGATLTADPVSGGKWTPLQAPWKGHDVVLRIRRQ